MMFIAPPVYDCGRKNTSFIPNKYLGSDPLWKRHLDLFATGLYQQLLSEIRISVHSRYAIGSSRFREEIKNALKLRATPRGPGRQPARLAV
jgi:hypothetical protein